MPIETTWKIIVLGTGNKNSDLIISQFAYLIYKAWVLEINDKKVPDYKRYLCQELNDKAKLYTEIGHFRLANDIIEIVKSVM